MKYLVLLLLLTSCNGGVEQLFLDAKTNGCMRVSDVTYGSMKLGNFVICREDEYDRRVGK